MAPQRNASATQDRPTPAWTPGGPVVIAGGGIAGLTAALALARRGLRSVLHERVEAFTEVGAGLQISPNAFRVLDALGLGAAIAAKGTAPEAVDLHGLDGRVLASIPLGETAVTRWGAPYFVLHRADLIAILAEAAEAEPAITLVRGVEVEDFAETPAGVTVSTTAGTVEGEALIAADGVWSRLRPRMPGPRSTARPTGKLAYRTLIPADAVAPPMRGDRVHAHLAPGAHVVRYPILGGRFMNVVAVAASGWFVEDWAAPAGAPEIEALSKDFDKPLRDLLLSAPNWTRWPLSTVDASGSWTAGRVALIGDAAHASLPFAAQGAALAIEDAAVLAARLAAGPTVGKALAAYEAERRHRAVAVQKASARNGEIYHLSGIAAKTRNLTLSMLPRGALMEQLDWIYEWRLAA